jgi:hypothetical protein
MPTASDATARVHPKIRRIGTPFPGPGSAGSQAGGRLPRPESVAGADPARSADRPPAARQLASERTRPLTNP